MKKKDVGCIKCIYPEDYLNCEDLEIEFINYGKCLRILHYAPKTKTKWCYDYYEVNPKKRRWV